MRMMFYNQYLGNVNLLGLSVGRNQIDTRRQLYTEGCFVGAVYQVAVDRVEVYLISLGVLDAKNACRGHQNKTFVLYFFGA